MRGDYRGDRLGQDHPGSAFQRPSAGPFSGKVYVEGIDLSSPHISWAQLRQRVGLVFQYPEHQLSEETVFDDISFVLRQREGLSVGGRLKLGFGPPVGWWAWIMRDLRPFPL